MLGLCALLQLGPERVPVLQECHKVILPAMVLLFQGLKRAYAGQCGFAMYVLYWTLHPFLLVLNKWFLVCFRLCILVSLIKQVRKL